MAGPAIYDLDTLLQAGINPKTGLPIKLDGSISSKTKSDIKQALRIVDEQDAINRYKWINLPCNITSQELERLLYYKGQLCFFYMKELDEFYFMPYALDGTIDFYGRFNTVHPVPMTTGTDEDKSQAHKNQTDLLSKKKLRCRYGVVVNEEDLTIDTWENSCVLLHDYSKQMSQTIIARQIVNDGILDVMADMIPYMNTSLLLGTGIKAMRVQDADQADNVFEAARAIKKSALSGLGYIPIVGTMEFQDLATGTMSKPEDYMVAMQSLDNFRLSLYGIDNGGLFEKKAQELQTEANINGGPIGLVMQDGLSIRQNFCNIVNSIWGLDLWCEPSETISKADINGDGVLYDENQGESTGVDTDTNGGEGDE